MSRITVTTVLIFALLACAFAQFSAQTATSVSAGTFDGGNAAYIRAYRVADYNGHIVLAEGFRAVGGVANHTAGLAADLMLFAADIEFDAAVGAAYFEAIANASWNAAGNLSVSFEAAGIAAAIRFFKLLEFVDNNGQPGFQPGSSDTLVGYYNILGGPWRWNNFTLSRTNITGTTAVLFQLETSTTDNVFAFRVTITGNYTELGRYKVDPGSLKLDVLIQYYNNPLYNGSTLYASGPSSASAYPTAELCLVAGVIAASGSEVGYASAVVSPNNGGLANVTSFAATDAKGHGVYFTYDNNPFLNGDTTDFAVVVDVQADLDATNLFSHLDAGALLYTGVWAKFSALASKSLHFFSYTGASRPSKIEWDPSLETSGINQGTLPPTTMVMSMSPAPSQHPPPPPPPPTSPASALMLSTGSLLLLLLLLLVA